jgi:hypothetical protein
MDLLTSRALRASRHPSAEFRWDNICTQPHVVAYRLSALEGIKNNLLALKTIRDEVEHKMLGRSDAKWLALFQACCLNFDKVLVARFGPRLTLQQELAVALQFGKLELEQMAQLTAYDVPPNITALDALLKKDLKEEELDDLEFQFRVVYTFDSASKGKAHIQFLSPDSAEGKSVQNVLCRNSRLQMSYTATSPVMSSRSSKRQHQRLSL